MCMNWLEQRIYHNARTLTKLMMMHNLEYIDREIDYEFDGYFDDLVEVAFIMHEDVILHLFDGERYIMHGLAKEMREDHYGYATAYDFDTLIG